MYKNLVTRSFRYKDLKEERGLIKEEDLEEEEFIL